MNRKRGVFAVGQTNKKNHGKLSFFVYCCSDTAENSLSNKNLHLALLGVWWNVESWCRVSYAFYMSMSFRRCDYIRTVFACRNDAANVFNGFSPARGARRKSCFYSSMSLSLGFWTCWWLFIISGVKWWRRRLRKRTHVLIWLSFFSFLFIKFTLVLYPCRPGSASFRVMIGCGNTTDCILPIP